MTLPRPGAARIDNLVATLLLNGNGSHTLDLGRIAHFQGIDAGELSTAFARAETTLSLTPRNCVIPEGE